MLGQALDARRKDIVLATKVFVRLESGTNKGGLSRRHILEACEASLRRLGTDYIDLYQAHNFDSLKPLDETLRAFEDLIRAGSFATPVAPITRAGNSEKPCPSRTGSEFRAISRSRSTIRCWPATPNMKSCPPATSVRALWPGVHCNSAPRGVSISQVALNWVTRKPGVDTVIIGARNEKQLRDNLSAANWTLTDAEVERLDEASASRCLTPIGISRNSPGIATHRRNTCGNKA